MAKLVEITPTKVGRSSLGRKNLFVPPEHAKVHVQIGTATYATKEEPKPVPQQYATRQMTAASPEVGQSRRDRMRAMRAARAAESAAKTPAEDTTE